MRKTVLAFLLMVAVSLGVQANAQQAAVSPAQSLFDQATFYLGFYYSGPGKIANYRELRKQYQAKLDAACAGDTKCPYSKALTVINEIIASLNDPYVRFIGVDEANRLPEGQGPLTPRIGVITRASANGLVVSRVYEGEPAQAAGVQRGDVIQTVNGQPASLERLVAAELEAKAIQLGVSRRGTSQVVNVTAKASEEGQKPLELSGTPQGVMVIHIRDHYWVGEVARRVHQLVRKANNGNLKGIVLDLRDSDWGLESETIFIARAFTDQIGLQYKNRFQGGQRSFSMQGNQIVGQQGNVRFPVGQFEGSYQNWRGPVSVVVNRYTTHNNEMLAYLLQRAKRAQVVGEATAGQLGVSGGLPSLDVSIGDTEMIAPDLYLNLSQDRILHTDGTPWPMQVTPDVDVPEDLTGLANGTDAALARAIELLGVR
jgi:carboxyl-terminal processing protease